MNFCELFRQHLVTIPASPAIKHHQPAGETVTVSYAELFSLAGEYQQRLKNVGLKMGDKVLLLLPVSARFYALLYALLGAGIVPVLLERKISLKALRHCLQKSSPAAMLVAEGIADKWYLLPEFWRLRRFTLDGKRWGMKRLADFAELSSADFTITPVAEEATALITFTTGSTGLPKGAKRTHQSLIAQAQALANYFPLKQQNDMSTFPVLTLFSHFCGNCSNLIQNDGETMEMLVKKVINESITQLSAAPYWMNQLLAEARRQDRLFPCVRQLIIGGAPVNKTLLHNCISRFPIAKCYLNYGSTEAEPVSRIEMQEMLNRWDEHPGYPVGQPSEETQVLIRRLPLSDLRDLTPTSGEEPGEILVSGPHVLKAYYNQPQATCAAKITDNGGRLWHCTGDTGFLDSQGQLWLTGRVKDRIITRSGRILDAFIIEKQLNEISSIERSAVVATPKGEIALVLQKPQFPLSLPALLSQWFSDDELTIYYTETLPVDVRHHSRIDRRTLRHWLVSGKLNIVNKGEVR